jgi:hypothetical protein
MPMTRCILILLLLAITGSACRADGKPSGLQVDVKREGNIYTLSATVDTSLSKCAAYNYLVDYDAARKLPGVIKSLALRQSANQVKVERTASERILFFHVRMHSVMMYTEQPDDGVSFVQLSGDSKMFNGSWDVEAVPQGSVLRFHGLWQPDTFIPLFIIDHFAKGGLVDQFRAMANLAEKLKSTLSANCMKPKILVASRTENASDDHSVIQRRHARN